MKKTRKQNTPEISMFIKEFSAFISEFESGIEGVMEIITGSFDNSKKDSEVINSLFKNSRSEAELIFSLFSGIAGLFSGGAGGGLLNSLLGIFPGGEFIGALLGGLPPSPGSPVYPLSAANPPAPVVIVNTQLEKAGMYRVYREGKIISEMRPSA